MFNLKKHSNKPVNLLEAELILFDIKRTSTGYRLIVGDEQLEVSSLQECSKIIEEGISELKEHLWGLWQKLEHLSTVIANNEAGNRESIDNILFLNNVKKSFSLSSQFDDLGTVSSAIKQLLDIDINSVHNNLIVQFNQTFLSVKLLHRLIMIELYRLKVIRQCGKMGKVSGVGVEKVGSVSGPWANLDLPTQERVWPWDQAEEEYFSNRQKSRREQVRYNPEEAENTNGVFFVWVDQNRSPYRWTDRQIESPYKSRLLVSQP